jgi:hypothetical protein
MRLKAPLVNVLSKTDLMQEKVKTVLSWSSNIALLEQAIAGEKDNETYLLSMELLKTAVKGGVSLGLLPVSSESMDGMINLEAALGRIFKMGEAIED